VLIKLQPWADLLPTASAVNVNTAPREALLAAIDNLDVGSAERLVQARKLRAFERLEDIKAQLPPGINLEPSRIAVGSAYFEVAGRLRLEDRVLEERSLLVRRDGRVDVLRRERRSYAASEQNPARP
jgi:general secretion pathway protein K